MIVEDVGGTTVAGNARIPNSFVYRFVPVNPTGLTKGKLGGALASGQATPAAVIKTIRRLPAP
jgi:hypothetical protein